MIIMRITHTHIYTYTHTHTHINKFTHSCIDSVSPQAIFGVLVPCKEVTLYPEESVRGRSDDPDPERALRPRSLGVGTVCRVNRLEGDLGEEGVRQSRC